MKEHKMSRRNFLKVGAVAVSYTHLVLYRMEKMGIHVIDLPRLGEHVLGQLLSNDANTTECQGLPY